MHHSLSSRWKLRVIITGLAVLTVVLSACGAGNTPSASATTGPVKIGNAGTLIPNTLKWGEDSTGGMPYIVPKDNNNPSAAYYGFEYDIAAQMAKLMNVQQVPTQITWSNWPQGLASQQFDVFMNGLEITSDNVKSAKFSIPYYVYTQSIVVLNSNTTINGFSDLAGKTVETGTGYEAENVMDNYNSQNPNNKINIKTTDNPTPFTDLQSKRVDAMFIDTPIAAWYGANDPGCGCKIVGGDIDPGYYGIAFNPTGANTATLMKEVNQTIEQLWNNGMLKHIYQDGGAYNQDQNGPVFFEKYGMWGNAEACIGNFLPDHPTNVAGCPALPAGAS